MRFWHRFVLASVVVTTLSSCTTMFGPRARHCTFAIPSDPDCKPFRAGIVKLSPERDAEKTLATNEWAGWIQYRDDMIGGYDDFWLTSYQLKSKRHRWWYNLTKPLSAPPLAHENDLYVGTQDGLLVKLDATNGKKAWEAKLSRFVSRAMVEADRFVVAVTANNQVYGIDAQTGGVKWVYGFDASESIPMAIAAAPVVREKVVYVGLATGAIVALSLNDGKELWKYEGEYTTARFKDVVGSIYLVGQRLIYARNDGRVVALDYQGTVRAALWETVLPSITTSEFREGTLYLGCLNGDVIAIDATSGRKLWQFNLVEPIASMIAGESALYVGTARGMIASIQQKGDKLNWYDHVRGTLYSKPFFYADQVHFMSGMEVIYSYKL